MGVGGSGAAVLVLLAFIALAPEVKAADYPTEVEMLRNTTEEEMLGNLTTVEREQIEQFNVTEHRGFLHGFVESISVNTR